MGVLLGLGMNVLIIVVIVYVIRSIIRLRRKATPGADEHWYMHPFVSVDDALGQLILIVGLTLGVVGTLVLSRRVGLPVRADTYLFVGVIVAYYLAWRMRAPLVFIAAMFGTWGWWSTAAWAWVKSADAGGVAVPLGLGLFSIAFMALGRILEATERGRRFGWFSWLFGMLGGFVFLFWISSQEGIAQLGQLRQGSPFVASPELAVVTAAALGLSLGAVVVAAVSRSESLGETIALGVGWVVLLALAIRPPIKTAYQDWNQVFEGNPATLTPTGMTWAVIFNVLLLAGLLGLVFLGYQRRENWLVNLGAALLFVFVAFKYFDWLFTFMDRSIAFIVSGLLLIAVGAGMESGRRYVLKAMEADDGGA